MHYRYWILSKFEMFVEMIYLFAVYKIINRFPRGQIEISPSVGSAPLAARYLINNK